MSEEINDLHGFTIRNPHPQSASAIRIRNPHPQSATRKVYHANISMPPHYTLRLTFTANAKPLAKVLILQLYYNSFTPVLKYVKQLLNLCSLQLALI
jgi:hypothetical protein